MCLICREVLGDDPLAITALPCGHVFHTYCVTTYAEAQGCKMEHACVYRCHTTSWIIEVEDPVSPPPGAPPTVSNTPATTADRETAARAQTEMENWFG